ncbi:MAG: division/cell wall cluster transcriptional repressor MraZ [Puniceicoccaceae bacterium]
MGKIGFQWVWKEEMVAAERAFYVGEFEHALDAKGRLTIPSKWRFLGDEADVYLALPNPGGFITVYPPKMIDRFEEQVSKISLGDPEGQKLVTQLGAMSHSFGCDKQGRINLNEKLIRHAGIGKKAILVGNFSYFSIHAAERYEAADLNDPDLMNRILRQIHV